METEIEMGKIAEMAVTVGEEQEELEDAIQIERARKAEILARVIEAVLPAMRALVSRVQVAERASLLSPEPARDYLQGPNGRAILVATSGVNPKTGRPVTTSLDGRYSGRALFLSETGAFIALEYAGTTFPDDDPQGRAYAWGSDVFETLDHNEVVAARWPVGEIVDRLAKALEQHLGGKMPRRTIAVEENIEKLRAVATLMKGIERGWR